MSESHFASGFRLLQEGKFADAIAAFQETLKEQPDPAALEQQIKAVTEKKEFQEWSQQVAALLEQSSKRELFKIIDSAPS
jgi:cytochrome c-type biogenesis protein CcmH/NrfG